MSRSNRSALTYMVTEDVMWLLALVGCFEGRAGLDVPIVAGSGGEAAFSTPDGGVVTLDAAWISFSDLRLEEPAAESTAVRVLQALSPINTAYAHPGHDYPGDVTGELLGAFTIDLLAPETSLGTAFCYEGEFATGRVAVAGSVASFGGVHVASDGTERPFHLEVSADQSITGIPFDATLTADAPPEAIALRFSPSAALQFVDWAGIDEGPLTNADAAAVNTVTFGTVATPTWSLALIP